MACGFGYLALLVLQGCQGQNERSIVEQIPKPDFDQIPQVFFLFDSDAFKLPKPDPRELEHQLNTRVYVESSSSEGVLRARIREFNARPLQILIVGPGQSLKTAIEERVFQHPSRKLSLVLQAKPSESIPEALQSISLKSESILTSLDALCQDLSEAHDWGCTGLMEVGEHNNSIDLQWSRGPRNEESRANNPQISLRLRWDVWLEQILRELVHPQGQHAPWNEISMRSGSIEIESAGFQQLSDNTRSFIESRLQVLRFQGLSR